MKDKVDGTAARMGEKETFAIFKSENMCTVNIRAP
jgi:hypothetical protein